MAKWLKKGPEAEAIKSAAREVRETVEKLLSDIEQRGDAAVRELCVRFDKVDRDDYRLTDSEIQKCVSQLSKKEPLRH
jgi:sulfopropanediol 3-dehydrogenase